MNKLMGIMISLLLVCSGLPANASAVEDETATYLTLDEFSTDYNGESTVLQITDGDITEFKELTNSIPDIYTEFLSNNGIIVLRTEEKISNNILDEQLGVQFKELANNESDYTENSTDPGINIATIYYKHNNIMVVHQINVGSNDMTDPQPLISEVINEARLKQNSVLPVTRSAGYDAECVLIGERDYTYTREPKGKFEADYDCYTVQSYNNKDYYIIKCNSTGMPGADLAAGDSNFNSKYKGEEIVISISSGTSSVTRDAYGPTRTVSSGSFSVELGASLDAEKVLGISAAGSYIWNLEDTSVDVSLSSAGAEWDFSLTKGAKEASCSVLPGITFACPYNKANISVTTSASYTLDSWDTLNEVISLNKTFTCSPTTVSGS